MIKNPHDTRTVASGVQKMTPSEAFVETLVANGVTDMFGIMGSAFMDAMDIFAPAGIRLIPVVHEQGAAHMADGYARVSGRHGVTIGQNGPGISNCVTAIAAAYWAHSPVVIITPETGTTGIGLGGFQEANQLPMFEEFTKYQGHVTHPKRMAEYTARCFDRAMSDNGPTQLNIPRDYFYGELTCEIPKPMRVERGAGGENSLNAAADLLANAKFPVILAGGGVVMGNAVAECQALAERLGAPVVTSLLYMMVFVVAVGGARPDVGGVAFATFIAPGLIMMTILNNAFANSSSSLLQAKVNGLVGDFMTPPLTPPLTSPRSPAPMRGGSAQREAAAGG